MEKRTLLALALSFLILGFYPVILKKIYPEYGKAKVQASMPARGAAAKDTSAALSPAGVYSEKDDVPYKNEKLRLLFNRKDGAIREIAFADYMDYEHQDLLKLISLKEADAAPLSMLVSGDTVPASAQQVRVLDANKVVSSFTAKEGRVKVERSFSFHPGGYAADLSVRLENLSDSPVDVDYELFAGSRIPPRHTIDSQYIEANFFSMQDGKPKLRHIKEAGIGKKVESGAPVEWIALKDRHFSIILKPKASGIFSGLERGLGKRQFSVSLVSPKVPLAPHASATQEFLVYIGPNEIRELLPLGLEDLVNFGKLDLIGKILVGGLEILHKFFRNYGVAIIALTALINLMLFPMTRLSYMSMKRMQLIQPQMNKLREQYKKNPEKLNKETMELYKKHKVNPFGGCLPMFLQMPVFIALYVALSKSVILIDAKFLWARDLSSPDSVLLPLALPFFGQQIHVLPLIMCAAMFVQQRFTQIKIEGQDPSMEQQQKMMGVMMPVIFGFIFYSMPSGLVLYWLTNTIIMSSYQLYLKRVTLV